MTHCLFQGIYELLDQSCNIVNMFVDIYIFEDEEWIPYFEMIKNNEREAYLIEFNEFNGNILIPRNFGRVIHFAFSLNTWFNEFDPNLDLYFKFGVFNRTEVLLIFTHCVRALPENFSIFKIRSCFSHSQEKVIVMKTLAILNF